MTCVFELCSHADLNGRAKRAKESNSVFVWKRERTQTTWIIQMEKPLPHTLAFDISIDIVYLSKQKTKQMIFRI